METTTQDTVTLTEAEAVELIRQTNGKIFGLCFVKRTTGEERTMSCRLGVKAYLTGAGAKYDFAAKKLLSVFEMGEGGGYKAVPIDGLTAVIVDGKKVAVTHGTPPAK